MPVASINSACTLPSQQAAVSLLSLSNLHSMLPISLGPSLTHKASFRICCDSNLSVHIQPPGSLPHKPAPLMQPLQHVPLLSLPLLV